VNDSRRFEQALVVLGWAGLGLLLYLVYLIARPFLNPLAWGTIIAIVFHPLHLRFERRWGASRAAALTTALVVVIIVVPMLLVMTAFVREAVGAFRDLEDGAASGGIAWLQRAWTRLTERIPAPRADVAAAIADVARRAALFLAAQSGLVLQNTAAFVLDLFLAHFAAFFILRDSPAIMRLVRRLLPFEPVNRERMIARTRDLVSITITSSGIVAATQGVLGGLSFAMLGIGAPIFWGVVMGFFCLMPFGAWVIWLPAAMALWLNGSPGRALALAVLGLGIVSGVDNVLRPVLLSGRTQLNGLLVFVSLLGGLAAFGALGLVLGPILVASAQALVTAYLDTPEGAPPG
jgi:predicted PurR-regulated permease PerM